VKSWSDALVIKRPIVCALLFLLAGILWGRYLPGILFFAILCVIICGLLCKRMKYPPIFLCVILALAGVLGVQHRLEDGVVSAGEIEFIGLVQDIRLTRAGWQRLVVLAPEGITDGEILLARSGAQILTYLSPEYRVEIGQRVRLTGGLHALDGPRNPGGYNEFMVQRTRRIAGKFYAREAEAFEIHMNVARATFMIRNRLAEVYNGVLPYREANLIQSVVLGERPDMDDPVVEMYRMAGIYHLLVVSGLHLSILMMAACLILERVLNKRTAGLIALILMIGYTLVTGASISTVRAVTMAGVAVCGRLLYRDRDALASVSFACILLLLYEPLYLFGIGFQLSFGTVFGLILLTGPTERALALCGVPPYKKLRPFLAYNIVATVSTYPILAYHFSHVAVYSFWVNIIIMPTAVLLVIVGLLVGIVGLFSISGAFFLAGAIYYLLQFYEAVIRGFLSLPGAVWLIGSWGIWVTLAAMGVMLTFGYAFSGFGEDFRKRMRLLWLTVGILIFCIGLEAIDRNRFHVTALDVGQGSSYVLRAGGHSFVLDGGGNNRLIGMNTGEMVLMPYLDHRGIGRADAAFVSSTSRQQIMGLIELTMRDRVRVLYIPTGLYMDSGLGMRLGVAARQNDIPIYRVGVGDTVIAGELTIVVISDAPRLALQVIYRDYEVNLPLESFENSR